MALMSDSLMPVLGKEIGFIAAQSFLLISEQGFRPLISLGSKSNVFIGTPTDLKSGIALTVVLAAGLVYEMKHALHHSPKT